MKIAFVCGSELIARPLDFTRLWDDDRGLTGSESSVLHFAREMVKRGHEVTLYITNPNAAQFDSVSVVDLSLLGSHANSFDVVFSISYSRYLRNITKSLRVNYLTGNSFDGEAHHFEDDVDIFLSPSRAHLEYMQKWTLTAECKWQVLRLGCYPEEYLDTDVPGRVVHTSSPDRGLHMVLQEWPAILAAVPNATLRIFYHGLDEYIRNASQVPRDAHADAMQIEHGCRARYIDAALKRLKNVEVIGSVSRNRMRRELSEAMVLAYPCQTSSYSEGFSVSTLEGCASGALPVIAACDALGSIYRGVVPMVDAPARTHITEWRNLVIRALTDESWRALQVAKACDFALGHDYKLIAADMEKIFERGIDAKRRAPAVSVNPVIRLDMVLTEFASGPEPIDPERFLEVSHGGGSRIGFMHLMNAVRRRGDYDVRAFAKFTQEAVGRGGGCYQLEKFGKDGDRDVALAFYDTSPLRDVGTGCLRIASHHTYVPPDIWFSTHSDVSVAPTQHAVDGLRRWFDPHGTWYVLPNGVHDPGVVWQPVSGRVLHHASSDRGLHLLFGVWPAIRRAVPHATLHVVGDPRGWAWGDQVLSPAFVRTVVGKRMVAMRAGIASATSAGGVEILGKVRRDVLCRELSEAACFAYPASVTMPCETFSVSIMECMRVGVPVVLSPVDALGMYDDIARMVPAPAEDHMLEFEEAMIDVLRSVPKQLACHYMGKRFAVRYTHDREATVLDQIIRRHIP